MSSKRSILFFLLSLFSAIALNGQKFDYSAGYLGFFDNREYDNIYAYDQTMFGSRIRAEAGALIDGKNRFAAGIDYLYEFGSKGQLIAPDIVLYFNGSHNRFDYALGAMPRHGRINMPLALLTDTLNYYRPNIEGIYLEYKGQILRQNLWIDWTGRRSEITRESFTIGLSGSVDKGVFVYRHHMVINHQAHTLPKTPGVSLRDNIGYTVVAGVDFTSLTGLDTLTLTTGVLGSNDRLRGVYDFQPKLGLISELEVGYKGFGLHGILYRGENQLITSGDKSYTADLFTRGDVFYQITKKSIESRLQFSYQVLPDAAEMSILLVIRISIDGIFKHQKSN